MSPLNIPEAIRASALGGELDAAQAQALAGVMGVRRLGHGDVLVAEGADARTLFVLAEGRINVCKTVGRCDETVYQMRPGEVAGTRAFIDGSTRKAELRADGEASVLTLEPEAFESLIEGHPRLVYKVMRALFRVTHANLMRVNLESAEMRNYMMKTGGRY
jgi:CRP-like cAMP-binding protein